MFRKLIWMNCILSLFMGGLLLAVRTVEPPLYEERFAPHSIIRLINDLEREGHSNNAAKGILGERVAKSEIEKGKVTLARHTLKTVQAVFQENGCNVSFKHSGDRGIDSVFVVQGDDGWIDPRFNPIFHESKFSRACRVRLSQTRTLSEQLSFDWLKANLDHAKIKTSRMCITFPHSNEITLAACSNCRTKFQAQISWLQNQLQNGRFLRTASVLCPTGEFKIFRVPEN